MEAESRVANSYTAIRLAMSTFVGSGGMPPYASNRTFPTLELGDEGFTEQAMLQLIFAIVPPVGLIYGVALQIDEDEEVENDD